MATPRTWRTTLACLWLTWMSLGCGSATGTPAMTPQSESSDPHHQEQSSPSAPEGLPDDSDLNAAESSKSNRNLWKATGTALPPEFQQAVEEFLKAYRAGDVHKLDALIDWNAIFDRAVSKIPESDRPPTDLLRKACQTWLANSAQVFPEVPRQHDTETLCPDVIDQLGHCWRQDRLHVRFRSFLPQAQCPNYHELVFLKMPAKEVRIDDYRSCSRMLFCSETARNQVLFHSQKLDGIESLQELLAAFAQNRSSADLIHRLPDSAWKNRQLAFVGLTNGINETPELARFVIDKFRTAFPEEDGLDLYLMWFFDVHSSYAESLRIIDAAERSLGGDVYLDALRAAIAFDRGQLQDAERYRQRLKQRAADLPHAHDALLRFHARRRDFQAVASGFLEALRRFPHLHPNLSNDADFAQFVESPEYKNIVRQLAPDRAGTTPKSSFAAVQVALNELRLTDALGLFSKLRKEEPDSADAVLGQVRVYRLLSLFDPVFEDLDTLLKKQPKNAVALTLKGRSRREMLPVRRSEAKAAFRQAIEVDGAEPAPWNCLAIEKICALDWPSAIADLEKAVRFAKDRRDRLEEHRGLLLLNLVYAWNNQPEQAEAAGQRLGTITLSPFERAVLGTELMRDGREVVSELIQAENAPNPSSRWYQDKSFIGRWRPGHAIAIQGCLLVSNITDPLTRRLIAQSDGIRLFGTYDMWSRLCLTARDRLQGQQDRFGFPLELELLRSLDLTHYELNDHGLCVIVTLACGGATPDFNLLNKLLTIASKVSNEASYAILAQFVSERVATWDGKTSQAVQHDLYRASAIALFSHAITRSRGPASRLTEPEPTVGTDPFNTWSGVDIKELRGFYQWLNGFPDAAMALKESLHQIEGATARLRRFCPDNTGLLETFEKAHQQVIDSATRK